MALDSDLRAIREHYARIPKNERGEPLIGDEFAMPTDYKVPLVAVPVLLDAFTTVLGALTSLNICDQTCMATSVVRYGPEQPACTCGKRAHREALREFIWAEAKRKAGA